MAMPFLPASGIAAASEGISKTAVLAISGLTALGAVWASKMGFFGPNGNTTTTTEEYDPGSSNQSTTVYISPEGVTNTSAAATYTGGATDPFSSAVTGIQGIMNTIIPIMMLAVIMKVAF